MNTYQWQKGMEGLAPKGPEVTSWDARTICGSD